MYALRSVFLKLISFFAGLAVLFAAAWVIFPDEKTEDYGTSEFKLVGYFKSSVNDRVFTISMPDDTKFSQFSEYAKQQPYTDGQMTAVYGYNADDNIAADGISLAKSLFEANEVLMLPELSKPRFAFMIDRKGLAQAINCAENKANALCFN